VPARSAQKRQAEREKEPPSTQFPGAALALRRQEKMRSLAELARAVPSPPPPSAAVGKAKPLHEEDTGDEEEEVRIVSDEEVSQVPKFCCRRTSLQPVTFALV
jgi:hypothetical protein